MQKRIIPFSFKAEDDARGIFTGDANVFNVLDFAGERVLAGAFKSDLERRGARRPLQWQHNTAEPIGVVELVETDRSLRVTRGQLAMGVQRAREAYELLKVPGALGGMSIGYNVKADRIARDGVRELLEIEIFEVSLVTHPANPESRVDFVKQQDAVDLTRSLETMHRTLRSMRSVADRAYPSASATDRLKRMDATVRTLTRQVL